MIQTLTPEWLELVHADVMAARQMLFPENGRENMKRNPYFANMGAYHAEQAIEKILKGILIASGTSTPDLFYTHNIADLLVAVELVEPDFIKNHTFIAQNAWALTDVNNLRYGKRSISPVNAKGLYHAANALYREAMGKYMEETGKSAKDVQRDNWNHYKTQQFINFTFPQQDEEDAPKKRSGHEDFE